MQDAHNCWKNETTRLEKIVFERPLATLSNVSFFASFLRYTSGPSTAENSEVIQIDSDIDLTAAGQGNLDIIPICCQQK